MAVKLGNGNWAVKEDKLLAYNDNSGRFFNKEFDFARGSIATYVGKDGLIKSAASDVPRIDFSDSNSGALLLEPQRTNLITYSEDFSQWANQNAGTGSAPIITSNNTISPDGTQNADKVVFNKGAGVSTSDLSVIASSGFTSQTNTASFYIKADSPQRIVIRNSTNWQLVDVTTKWQRISKTDTGTGIQIGLRDGYGIANIPNTATIYLWGAQAEQGSYATSYIPSLSGSATTRLADVCNNSGSAQDFNSEEGVLYAEIAALGTGNYRLISLNNGSAGNSVTIWFNNGSSNFYFRVASSNGTVTYQTFPIDYDGFNKIALKYKSGDISIFANGTKKVQSSGTFAFASSLNKLNFDYGSNDGLPFDFYGNIKDLQVFTEAKSDEFLAALTTI